LFSGLAKSKFLDAFCPEQNHGIEDDGWNGTSDYPFVRVRAATFEQAKTDIEYALGKHLEQLLRHEMSNSERAA
jgi:hypothetical protein